MSDTSKDVTLSLKVMINKEKTKVLFAEADTDFVPILLSFLLSPLGRIAKLLEKQCPDNSPVFGSITSLYKSLANLDVAYFSTPAAKLMLLDPPSSSDSSVFRQLKLDVFKDFPRPKYFVCGSTTCLDKKSISMYYSDYAVCDCGMPLNKEVVVNDSEDTGVIMIKTASFIISDDLKMVPNSAGFYQTLMGNFGDTVADGAELRNLNLGTNEIVDLFKCCLLSNTPLTDFILNKGEIMSLPAKPEPGILLHQIENEEPAENGTKITLKLWVHKSTNKVLFAEAEDDFIELLLNFLIIPVSGVESLLETNTCLNSLDNLYRSISDVTLDKYFVTLDTKKRLMNPNIPHCSKSKSTFLPLNYGSPPRINYHYNKAHCPPQLITTSDSFYRTRLFNFKSPKGEGNYVREPTTYLVTDDLTVTPFYISSTFSILNSLNISLSDVEEREVNIGLQEGLSILKASLTSTSALTNGLMNRIMKKQPKQER